MLLVVSRARQTTALPLRPSYDINAARAQPAPVECGPTRDTAPSPIRQPSYHARRRRCQPIARGTSSPVRPVLASLFLLRGSPRRRGHRGACGPRVVIAWRMTTRSPTF